MEPKLALRLLATVLISSLFSLFLSSVFALHGCIVDVLFSVRSPVNETDNGKGMSVPSLKPERTVPVVQATDNPHGVEINPYPEVLGEYIILGNVRVNVR